VFEGVLPLLPTNELVVSRDAPPLLPNPFVS
jgi:hypothetical protein